MPRLTDAQLDERRKGLGATDVATAAGVNPYQSAFELYLDKIGELDVDATIDDAARGRMERGHRLEDVALEWDRDIFGEPYERVSKTIWHPRIKFMYCHPDARRTPWRKTKRLIEVKTSLRSWPEVPRHIEAQVQAQMACTGATACDILVLGFDGPPTRYVVPRDDEVIDALERLAIAFWDRVQRRDPPPVDGSQGASSWLDRTRWGDEPEIIADDAQRTILERLLKTRDTIEQLTAEDARLTQVLKLSMAGSSRMYAKGVGKINWTAPSDRRDVSWKEVAAAFRYELADRMYDRCVTDEERAEVDAQLDETVAKFTTERSQRTFRLTDLREETE